MAKDEKQPNRVYMRTPEEEKILREEVEYNQSFIDDANTYICNYRGINHSNTASGRQALIEVRNASIKAGKSPKEVLAAVQKKWNELP